MAGGGGAAAVDALSAAVQYTLRHRQGMVRLLGAVLCLIVFNTPMTGDVIVQRTASVAVLMAVYWLGSAFHITVTALIPLIAFPLFGILDADDVAGAYFNDIIFLFVGSFVVSGALVKYSVDKRLALKLLLSAGSRPRLLLLGFMGMSWFLSMWMSNTATSSMMVPLVVSVIRSLTSLSSAGGGGDAAGFNDDGGGGGMSTNGDTDETTLLISSPTTIPMNNAALEDGGAGNSGDGGGVQVAVRSRSRNTSSGAHSKTPSSSARSDAIIVEQPSTAGSVRLSDMEPQTARFAKALLIGVAYASSLGGTATLQGTGPNLTLVSLLRILYPSSPEISFSQWFVFGLPLSATLVLILWALFCGMFLRETANIAFRRAALESEYHALGPVRYEEKVIVADLALMALLWFFRGGFSDAFAGWGELFPLHVGDGTVAMAVSTLLLIIPKRSGNGNGNGSSSSSGAILSIDGLTGVPWDIILLLGGGFALATGFQVSGLAEWVGDQLTLFDGMPPFFLVLCIVAIITFMTELTSNVATSTILLPILGSLATAVGQNPLLLMLPGCLASSYAFMLPVATPPNAIAFSSGLLTIGDMAKPGFVMNCVAIVLLSVNVFVLGRVAFGIEVGVVPDWATGTSTGGE